MAQKMLKFVDVDRQMPDKRAAEERREDFGEIYREYAKEKAAEQAARCSQCGVPFCQSHCPLHNNIPDWLKLTAEGTPPRGVGSQPGDQHLPRDLRSDLPAGPPVRGVLRHRAVRPWYRHHRCGREVHHRHGVGGRLDRACHAHDGTPRKRWHYRRRPRRPCGCGSPPPRGRAGDGL